eukprot:TRINITY_DN63765_c0_g1_i1.p1 TRINITY_DN63765_c0_g1~~TRINITY_DN63765_c0_g1_i1.p1  ORF type:complete len:252 (+),score=27.71 TRINITY_DN63765_c0_g1_i1:490-1245(+)
MGEKTFLVYEPGKHDLATELEDCSTPRSTSPVQTSRACAKVIMDWADRRTEGNAPSEIVDKMSANCQQFMVNALAKYMMMDDKNLINFDARPQVMVLFPVNGGSEHEVVPIEPGYIRKATATSEKKRWVPNDPDILKTHKLRDFFAMVSKSYKGPKTVNQEYRESSAGESCAEYGSLDTKGGLEGSETSPAPEGDGESQGEVDKGSGGDDGRKNRGRSSSSGHKSRGGSSSSSGKPRRSSSGKRSHSQSKK